MAGGVVQVVQRITVGGIETMAFDLAASLQGETYVLGLEWSKAEILKHWPALAEAPCPFDGLGKPPGLRPSFILSVARRLKELRPRAVVAHHIGPLIYAGFAARLIGVPRILYVEHDIWHYEDANHLRLANIAGLLVRPHVVAVSDKVAQMVRRIMPGCEVTIIHNAINTNRFAPADAAAARHRLGLPVEARIVGAAGRLEHVKGQDLLLSAMAEVPDAMLVLAGGGSRMDSLKAQAHTLGIADRVRFLGSRNDMPQVFPAFDLACLPSRNEGLPLSVLEAQACGIPVVASDVGSVREAVCPDCGILVPAEDPPALAAAIRGALANPPTADPRAFVLKHFSWASMVSAYEALLKTG